MNSHLRIVLNARHYKKVSEYDQEIPQEYTADQPKVQS